MCTQEQRREFEHIGIIRRLPWTQADFMPNAPCILENHVLNKNNVGQTVYKELVSSANTFFTDAVA